MSRSNYNGGGRQGYSNSSSAGYQGSNRYDNGNYSSAHNYSNQPGEASEYNQYGTYAKDDESSFSPPDSRQRTQWNGQGAPLPGRTAGGFGASAPPAQSYGPSGAYTNQTNNGYNNTAVDNRPPIPPSSSGSGTYSYGPSRSEYSEPPHMAQTGQYGPGVSGSSAAYHPNERIGGFAAPGATDTHHHQGPPPRMDQFGHGAINEQQRLIPMQPVGSTNPPPTKSDEKEEGKDVWDFPDGTRPSRTGVGQAGSISAIDPTGPAHGRLKLEKRCCGCRQRNCMIVTFVLCIVIALLLFFIWPRMSSVSVSKVQSIKVPSVVFGGRNVQNPGIHGEIGVVLSLNSGNFVPWSFKSIKVTTYDQDLVGDVSLGSGEITGHSVSRGYSVVTVPVTLSYAVNNASDPAIKNFNGACSRGQPASLQMKVDQVLSGLTFFNKEDTIPTSYDCKPADPTDGGDS